MTVVVLGWKIKENEEDDFKCNLMKLKLYSMSFYLQWKLKHRRRDLGEKQNCGQFDE